MKTIEIIKGLGTKELLKWETEVKSVLDELNWKLTKTARALYLHQTAIQECTDKLQAYQQRAEETNMAMQFLSTEHPLKNKFEDDLYKTEISIFRLQNRLKKISVVKTFQLEIKKTVLAEEIKYYENILKSIRDLLNPPVVLRRVLNIPDGETARNLVPDEGKIFILQPKRERMDNCDYYLPVAEAKDDGFFFSSSYEQDAIDVENYF